MARIRTIKPEFWTDEKLSLLDPVTRLVFLGLMSTADDAGRVVDNVKLIDGMLFPNTDDTCREALDTLARLSRITRYRSASGQSLIQITKWAEHQKVDKPSRHVLPGPETAVVVQPRVPEQDTASAPKSSRDSRETVARLSRSDLGPRTKDLGPSTAVGGKLTAFPKPVCDAAYERFIARIGSVDYGRFRKSLLPVYQSATSEHPTTDQLYAAIEAFAEAREAAGPAWMGGYTVEKLAQSIHEYVRLGSMPLTDDFGEPTERGLAAKIA